MGTGKGRKFNAVPLEGLMCCVEKGAIGTGDRRANNGGPLEWHRGRG